MLFKPRLDGSFVEDDAKWQIVSLGLEEENKYQMMMEATHTLVFKLLF